MYLYIVLKLKVGIVNLLCNRHLYTLCDCGRNQMIISIQILCNRVHDTTRDDK